MDAPLVLSPSSVDCYRRCPAQYYFSRVLKAEDEKKSGALVCGSCVHAAIASATRAVQAGSPIESLDPDKYFRDAWDAERGTTRVPIAWGAGGQEKVEATARAIVWTYLELEDLPDRIRRVREIEYPWEIELRHPDTGDATGVRLRGFIDIMEEDDEGLLRPRELKTSAASSKGTFAASELPRLTQAVLYSHAGRVLRGEEASKQIAYTVLTKAKAPQVLDHVATITDADTRRILLICLQVARAIRAGIFPLAVPSWLCASCGHARRCADSWADSPAAHAQIDAFATEALARSQT